MKHRVLTLMVCKAMLALMMAGCASPDPASQPARVEEITFKSGEFTLVGDLRLPEGKGPFPVVLFVHGSGPADRTSFGAYLPTMERMLQAGYATFAWDKPGTGESTGTLDDKRFRAQRAQILLDAINVMKARRDIDATQIGLWGASQAGYVMPRALAQSKDVAFMICVSCAGESSYDQMAFQVTALALCNGVPKEKSAQEAQLLAELDEARTYETYEQYLGYRETVKALGRLVSAPVERWPVLSQEGWRHSDPSVEAAWNPIEVIEQTTIPVLAIFGDKDRQIDPLQGAYAYRKALEQAGNPTSRVEVFANANHAIAASMTACPAEDALMFQEYLKSLGYGSVEEAQAAILKDPYKPGLMKDPPFAPGYLDLIEEWLRDLRK